MKFQIALSLFILPVLAWSQQKAEPKSIQLDGCQLENMFVDLKRVDWTSLQGNSVVVTYKGCGLMGSGIFRGSTQVQQKLQSQERFQSLMKDLLGEKKEAVFNEFERFSEREVGAWMIRYKDQAFVRYITLPSSKPGFVRTEPTLGAFTALDELIKATAAQLKLGYQPDQILFLRRDKSLAQPLNPGDLELFQLLQRTYSRPRISIISVSSVFKEGIFSLDNFSQRYDPVYLGTTSLNQRYELLNQARTRALELITIAKERYQSNTGFLPESRKIIRPDVLFENMEDIERRLPRLAWAVSEGPTDYAHCWNRNEIARTYLRFVKVKVRGRDTYKLVPSTNLVIFCDVMFSTDYTLDNMAVIVLHEATHQIGVGSESEATTVSNLIYISATGKQVAHPGYENSFNLKELFKGLQNTVTTHFPTDGQNQASKP